MTSIVDSEAQFDLRLEQVRVPVALRQALKNSGVSTISALAYAYGQPGQQIVAEDFHNWVRQLEPGVTIGGVSALKRLLFESQTQLLAILKEQITNPEPSAARKVPQAERDARMANLRARLRPEHPSVHSFGKVFQQADRAFLFKQSANKAFGGRSIQGGHQGQRHGV